MDISNLIIRVALAIILATGPACAQNMLLSGAGLGAAPGGGGGGTVSKDAVCTSAAHANAATTLDLTTLTVGSGSNRAMVLTVTWSGNPIAVTVANWDQTGTPQAMTAIVAPTVGGTVYAALYGLVAPTSGNKTARLTWTAPLDVNICAISFTGANQTGGATTFPGGTSNTATGTTATVAVTSATGQWTVAALTTPSADPSAPTKTQMYIDLTNNNNNSAASEATGAATVTHQFTLSTSNTYIFVGTSVAP